MRDWKNWLFPILTLLTVTALALLPLRLSVIEDGKLTGTVHAEGLSEDTNFPFKPPDLPGRVWLLVQYQELPDSLTIMSQELEGAERDREIQRLQEALADLGALLPPETAALLTEADGDSWDWTRCYLRDQTDLSSASFTMASTYDKSRRTFLHATMDGESGQVLSLTLHSADGLFLDLSPLELGKAILDRLGLDCVPAEDFGGSAACFLLPECKSRFWLMLDRQELDFNFTLDWSALDAGAAAAYGYVVTDSDTSDAGLMQKW